jgi:transcriptional regulator with XRE-family HTH domain
MPINDVSAEWYFAQQLHAIRDAWGFTQAQIADEMNRRLGGDSWRQQTVQKIEKGTRQVRLDEAVELAAMLGTDLATMIRPTGLDARGLRELVRKTKAEWRDLMDRRRAVRDALREAEGRVEAWRADLSELNARYEQHKLLLEQLQAMQGEGKK